MTDLDWWIWQLQYRLKQTKGRTDNLYIRDCLMMINRLANYKQEK